MAIRNIWQRQFKAGFILARKLSLNKAGNQPVNPPLFM